jgi:hypothetical protein
MYFPENVVSYRAFRFVYDMEAVTRAVDSLGVYDFGEPGNETGVSIAIEAAAGSGDLTVHRASAGVSWYFTSRRDSLGCSNS